MPEDRAKTNTLTLLKAQFSLMMSKSFLMKWAINQEQALWVIIQTEKVGTCSQLSHLILIPSSFETEIYIYVSWIVKYKM